MAFRRAGTWEAAGELQVSLVAEPKLVKTARVVKANAGSLYLSPLDTFFAKVDSHILYLFPRRDCTAASRPTAVVREALVEALVWFYPLTGRLGRDEDGKLEIKLTGEGAVFVEAEANLTLTELGFEQAGVVPAAEVGKKLVFKPAEAALLVVQVTKFRCGGWALGVSINHAVFDGVAAMKFMSTWARLARGEEVELADKLLLDRRVLQERSPPCITHKHAAHVRGSVGEHEIASFCFTPDQIQAIKERAKNVLPPPSTFEALAAHVWKARTRALNMHLLNPDEETVLGITMNVRGRVDPTLPPGFLGNGIIQTQCMATAGDLCSEPVASVVGRIQAGLAQVTDEFVRSYVDYLWENPELVATSSRELATPLLTSWTKLAFHLSDFGWGEPVYAGLAYVESMDNRLLFLSPHAGRKMNVYLLIGLPPAAMDAFQQELQL